MGISDALCIIAALLLAYVFRFESTPKTLDYLGVIALAPLMWIGVFHGFSLYATHHLSAFEEFRRTISATAIGVVLIALISFWSKHDFSRKWVGLTLVLALVLELAVRRGWRRYTARRRQDGRLSFRTLVVGANDEASDLMWALRFPDAGFTPIGYVVGSDGQASANELPILGSVDELVEIVRRENVECLFTATTALSSEDVIKVAVAARRTDTEVRLSANLPQILTTRATLRPVGDVMALSLRTPKLSGRQVVTKRIFDIVVSVFIATATAPLWLTAALAIKLTSGGPVLFRQDRVTKGGRTFKVCKLRTMSADGDRILEERGIDLTAPYFKLDHDPRVGRLGRFLRRSSIDELPQLYNVIKGDMSLVGPRPLPADQVAANLELLGPRHEVPAGVTGWWQIQGRSEIEPEKAVEMDLFYIDNWSLAFDLFILAKTLGVVTMRKGAS
jgi:exopolysaccharide biosynthesis polyprenyl glycosylphosphotransferase